MSHPKKLSHADSFATGCFNTGVLAVFLLMAIPTFCYLGSSFYKNYVEGSKKNLAVSHMCQFAAFIQHDRKQGTGTALSDMSLGYMSQMLAFYLDSKSKLEVTCYEIPEAERKGRLKGMEFYLFDTETETGVLANGTVFDGKLGPDLLQRLQAGDLK